MFRMAINVNTGVKVIEALLQACRNRQPVYNDIVHYMLWPKHIFAHENSLQMEFAEIKNAKYIFIRDEVGFA